jgi:hypothetical protein
MKRTNITDAITTTSVILFVLALAGDPTDTGFDWLVRAICVYPFTHLAWRAYREKKQG